MSDALLSALAIGAMLLVGGGLIGLTDRRNFSAKWLGFATILFFLNDAALTRAYGAIPKLLGVDWNWTGKILALLITLAVVAMLGWSRTGLTLKQREGSLPSALAVCVVLAGLFIYFALSSDDSGASAETMAYQLTMPGLEEEPFYRGTLLLALSEAFRGRVRLLGIEWGWSAFFSSALFGLAHAFGFEEGVVSFDVITFAMTGGPALALVWLRERTGSLLLPVLLHNFGNSIGLFV